MSQSSDSSSESAQATIQVASGDEDFSSTTLENSADLNKLETIPNTGPSVVLSRWEFAGVFIGLGLAIFVFALDQTIVSTALNAIISDLGGIEYVSWVGTAFLVAAAAVMPLYGKISDIFGRRVIFLAALAIFEAGSLVCALATSAITLIVGRAIQGIGGGGLYSLVLIIISDIVSFEDRGRYQGIIGAGFGVSTVVGPLLGGVFTDNLSWRWCFYINLPLGAITFITVAFLLRLPVPEGSVWEKLKKIDFLGAALIIATIVALIIPLQMGGSQWEWNSAATIGTFVASAVLFVVFFLVERYVAKSPIIPGNIFMNVSVYASFIFAFCLGAAFFAAVYYVPLYFQLAHGHSATDSGIDSLPMILGLVVVSITSGQLISLVFHGDFKLFLYICPVILAVGVGLLTLIRFEISVSALYGFQAIVGLGIGGLLQTRVLAIQASVDPPKIAVATSLSNFLQNFGGAVGLAISGTIFNLDLKNNLADFNIPQDLVELSVSYPQQIISQAPPEYLILIQRAFSDAIGTALYTAVPFPIIIFFVGFFIKSYSHSKPAQRVKKLSADEEKLVSSEEPTPALKST